MAGEGQPTLVQQIVTRLQADATVVAALPGGIYTRDIVQGRPGSSDPGATPDAWSPDGRHVRPNAVVRADPTTRGAGNARFADWHFIAIWLRVQANDTGKNELAAAVELVRRSLTGYRFPTPNGHGGYIRGMFNQTGYRDDPVIQNCLVDTIRFQAESIWRPPK